jgi:hypothetical protein
MRFRQAVGGGSPGETSVTGTAAFLESQVDKLGPAVGPQELSREVRSLWEEGQEAVKVEVGAGGFRRSLPNANKAY